VCTLVRLLYSVCVYTVGTLVRRWQRVLGLRDDWAHRPLIESVRSEEQLRHEGFIVRFTCMYYQ
jgi:hypothetical protein